MTRVLLPLVALALASCGGAPRPPAEAYEDFLDAVDRRDAEAAYASLDEAADGGHLNALARLIDAHERGYVTGRRDSDAPNLFVETPMWRTGTLRRRYARALRDSAAAGSSTALLHIAQRVAGSLLVVDGEIQSDLAEADRDTTLALYRRLVQTDVPRLPLAILAWNLGDKAAARGHLDEAVAAAEPEACAFRLYHTDEVAMDGSAAGFAAYVDLVEACPLPPGHEGMAARDVRAIVRESEAGNGAAAALLDSLQSMGMFERHPRLAALRPEAG